MATRTISTKLVIDGESEYRSAVSRINTELKTLQSNLKLTESQYQTNANSMEALKARHDALSAVYDAQKSKVDTLRTALDNAKSAQSDYSQKCAELRDKIQANNEAIEKLKSSTGDTSKEQKALADETAKLKKELEEEEMKLAAADKGVNSWQTQLNTAQIKLNDLDAELQKNDALLDEAKSSSDGCATSIDKFGNEVKESADATKSQNEALEALAAALAASGIKAGIDKITEALEACVDASTEFEHGMSGVGAIANASAEEMDLLTDKAKQIGATTVFTAGQASEALQYMALAGWSAEEMLQGVDGVINLAAASGENLATVSDIVTDALTAFGLKAEDSGHFVDVLAKTAASSNTTVTMLGEAFKYAAPLAGAMGYSVEDVAVAMGLMANQGIKGSQAGTAMRTMFTKLAGDITLTSDAFGKVTISSANADGSMKPLSESLDILRFYFNQMTEAEKLANAEAVAGKYAMSGLTAIMNSTQSDFDSLTRTISDCTGAASKMADVRMDNLQGQVTLMESAFDALKISVGDDLNPALRDLAKEGTDALTWAGNFIDEHEKIVPVVAAVAAGLTSLTGSVAAFAAGSKIVIPLVQALNAAVAANPFALAAVAAITLTTALVTLAATMPDTQSEYDKLSASSKAQYDQLEQLNQEYERACELYGENSNEARSLAEEIKLQTALYEQNKTTISQVSEKTSELISRQEALRQASAESESTIEAQRTSTEYLNAKLQDLMDEEEKSAGTKQQILAVVDLLNQEIPELGLAYDSYTDKLNLNADAIQAVIDKELEREKQASNYDELKERTRNQQEMEAQLATVRENLSAATERLTQVTAEMDAALAEDDGNDSRNAVSTMTEYISAVSAAKNEVDSLTEQEALLTAEMESNSEAIENLKGSYNEATEATDNLTRAEKTAAEAISEKLTELATAYNEAYESALKSLDGQFGLWESAPEVVSKSVDDMLAAQQSQADWWADYTDDLDELLNRNIAGVERLAAKFSDGSEESAAALRALSGATDTEIAQIIATMDLTEEAKQNLAARFSSLDVDVSGTLAAIASEYEQTVLSINQETENVDFTPFTDAVEAAFGEVGAIFEVVGTDIGSGLSKGIDSSTEEKVSWSANAMGEEVLNAVKTVLDSHSPSKEMESIGEDAGTGLAQGLDNEKEHVHASAEALGADIVEQMTTSGSAAVDAFMSEYQTIDARVRESLESAKASIDGMGAEIGSRMEYAGSQMIQGMINGLYNESNALYAAVADIVNYAIDTAMWEAGVHSPSWKTEAIFENVGEGMIVGVENKKKDVAAATQDVVREALTLDISGTVAMSDLLTSSIPDFTPLLSVASQASMGDRVANVEINVDMTGTVVREEADIHKISAELAQEIRTALRQNGKM